MSRRFGVPARMSPQREWRNRHTIGTRTSHTGAPIAVNVTAEGGGTTTPTLGGGLMFSREQLPVADEVPR